MFVYHATFKAYLEDIKNKGLLPNGSNPNFSYCQEDKCIYFDRYINHAGILLEKANNVSYEIKSSGIVVLAVFKLILNLSTIRFGDKVLSEEDSKNTMRYYGKIPPEMVFIVKNPNSSIYEVSKTSIVNIKNIGDEYLF